MAELKPGFQSYEERKKLYQDAFTWNKPERVLYNPNLYQWMYIDAGHTTEECGYNYALVDQIACEAVEKYNFDIMNVSGSPYRYCLAKYAAMGGGGVFRLNSAGEMNAVDAEYLGPDDYDRLKTDRLGVLWENLIFKMYPNAKKLTPQEFAEASKTTREYLSAGAATKKKLRETYGTLVEETTVAPQPFIERLFSMYRGMLGLSMDMRRQPEKVQEVCEYYDEKEMQMVHDRFDAFPYGPSNINYFDTKTALMVHSIMNHKQMEKFFYPFLKKFLTYMQEHGKLAFLQCEADCLRFADLLNEFPKGVINIVVEMDDPYEVRKQCPNVCISGGMSIDVMANGTKQECIDAAKKAIDELNCDGGLVLTTNKMVAYRNDMNAENLKAVCDFVRDYKIN